METSNLPAKSKAQRVVMAIAEHNPEALNPANRGLLKMTHQQLHDFATTPSKNLPEHVKQSKQKHWSKK